MKLHRHISFLLLVVFFKGKSIERFMYYEVIRVMAAIHSFLLIFIETLKFEKDIIITIGGYVHCQTPLKRKQRSHMEKKLFLSK